MSLRRPPPEPEEPAELLVELLEALELEDPLDEELLELVEYFVDELDSDSVRISVPKSVHASQTSSSAPSILTRFGFDVSVPHISHWTIQGVARPIA
jgi:hypothetical protein